MSDQITIRCETCKAPLVIESDNPPDDATIISCVGCGREFGTYSQVVDAAVALGKAEITNLVQGRLGIKPTWTKR